MIYPGPGPRGDKLFRAGRVRRASRGRGNLLHREGDGLPRALARNPDNYRGNDGYRTETAYRGKSSGDTRGPRLQSSEQSVRFYAASRRLLARERNLMLCKLAVLLRVNWRSPRGLAPAIASPRSAFSFSANCARVFRVLYFGEILSHRWSFGVTVAIQFLVLVGWCDFELQSTKIAWNNTIVFWF